MRSLAAIVGWCVVASSALLVPGAAFGQGQCTAFVTCTALDPAAHFLDANLDGVDGFALDSAASDRIATDGSPDLDREHRDR
jgi:hypothetical protein